MSAHHEATAAQRQLDYLSVALAHVRPHSAWADRAQQDVLVVRLIAGEPEGEHRALARFHPLDPVDVVCAAVKCEKKPGSWAHNLYTVCKPIEGEATALEVDALVIEIDEGGERPLRQIRPVGVEVRLDACLRVPAEETCVPATTHGIAASRESYNIGPWCARESYNIGP